MHPTMCIGNWLANVRKQLPRVEGFIVQYFFAQNNLAWSTWALYELKQALVLANNQVIQAVDLAQLTVQSHPMTDDPGSNTAFSSSFEQIPMYS